MMAGTGSSLNHSQMGAAHGALYIQVPIPYFGQPQWNKFPIVTETPPIVFGSFDQSEATEALTSLTEPYRQLSIATVGQQFVEGTHTTLYRVTVVPRRCAEGLTSVETPITVNLWVDGEQRLVRARTTTRTTYTIPKRALAYFPSDFGGTVVTTSTLQMYDYGTHVQIASPQPIFHPGGSGYGSGSFTVASGCSQSKHHTK